MYYVGKDYGDICGRCRAAIDDAALYVIAMQDCDVEFDAEAPLLFAGDHGWLCGGSYCAASEVIADEPPPARWRLWVWGKEAKLVKEFSEIWPNQIFADFAAAHGFTRLVRDNTLLGGYYANGQDDVLLCLPASLTPKSLL
jgi:hypothetical protein